MNFCTSSRICVCSHTGFVYGFRLFFRWTLLFSGRHMAPGPWRAVWSDALCYVSLWAGKTHTHTHEHFRSVLIRCISVSFFLFKQQRSRRGKVFGKVSCRNMKQDCPEPTCDDPILLPGHCCKTCPKGNTQCIHTHMHRCFFFTAGETEHMETVFWNAVRP